jgi:hypothetical protein
MAPLFDSLNIDVVLQGHEHIYQVMGPIFNKKLALGAVSDVQSVTPHPTKNVTGKKGGVFDVSKGTLYFLNNSSDCCIKFSPYPLDSMTLANTGGIENYRDFFTGIFGQNGNPTYSHVSVSTDSIVITTYEMVNGNDVELDKIRVVKQCPPYTYETLTYTNNQSLSSVKYVITDTLRITNNATVTFTNSTLRFYGGAKVIIDPGSKLIINNSTFTNSCTGRMWEGIIVKSNNNNHGIVEVHNSVIKNAICGITAQSGGKVVATSGAKFLNNKTGVKISGQQAGVLSSFTQTSFELDNNYFGNVSTCEGLLKMENSGEVTVSGCTFKNLSPINIFFSL